MSIGSRYVREGNVKNWSIDRIILSYGASLYTRLILWMPIADPTAGFICYSRHALQTIDLTKVNFIGYAFQIAMKYSAWIHRLKVKEVPITFKDRELGTSKMSLRIVGEAMWGVLRMRWTIS